MRDSEHMDSQVYSLASDSGKRQEQRERVRTGSSREMFEMIRGVEGSPRETSREPC